MNDRYRWPIALTIIYMAWTAVSVAAPPSDPLVLAEQVEPDESEAERIRRRDRQLRREQNASEDATNAPSGDAGEPPDPGDETGKQPGGRPESTAAGEAAAIGGSDKPGERGAAGSRGNEVSEQMLERRDERKAIMEQYRESGEKVTGQKPWYEDNLSDGTGDPDGDARPGDSSREADQRGGREVKTGPGSDGDGDGNRGKGAKGKSGKSKGKN
jgi:hypothetical protein